MSTLLIRRKAIFQQISYTEDLVKYFGFPLSKTRLRTACALIREQLSSSSEEWSQVVRSYDNLGARIGLQAEPYAFPGISDWFLEADLLHAQAVIVTMLRSNCAKAADRRGECTLGNRVLCRSQLSAGIVTKAARRQIGRGTKVTAQGNQRDCRAV